MAEWAGSCAKCGHPSSYHGMTFCMVDAGGPHKKQCDCNGFTGISNHYHDRRMGRAVIKDGAEGAESSPEPVTLGPE